MCNFHVSFLQGPPGPSGAVGPPGKPGPTVSLKSPTTFMLFFRIWNFLFLCCNLFITLCRDRPVKQAPRELLVQGGRRGVTENADH